MLMLKPIWILIFGSVLLFPLTLCGEEPATGFERIFDGKSFEGWEHSGNWSIDDGAF